MKRIICLLIILCTYYNSICVLAQTPQDSITLVHTQWQKEELAPGLTALQAGFSHLYGGPQRIFILEIDIRKNPLHIQAHQGRELSSDIAKSHEALAAINGTYFDMGEQARSVCYIANEGQVIDFTKNDLGFLSNGAIILKGKKLQIKPWMVAKEKKYILGKKSVMSCGPLMVQKGKEIDLGPNPGSHIPNPNPRSGIALLNKRKVLLIVVDGRKPGIASGVTIPQFAHLTRILGAKSALNLDGGGSSVLWTKAKGILNKPSDGRERTVSNSILVY